MSSRAALRRLMGQAASAGSMEAVYQAALHCVQYGLDVERASLLLIDSTRQMRFVAWSGLSDGYRAAVDGHSPWSPDQTDAVPVLISDVERDPQLLPFRAVLEQEGIRACAFIPLQFGTTLLGKFMLYYREPHAFSHEEIATAEQIADYVVFALEYHRIAVALEAQLISERELRHRAETEAAQRQESESRLHVALTAGQMGAWEWDFASGQVHWSEELERIHGLAAGTFEGTTHAILSLLHPLDVTRFAQATAAALSSSIPRDYAMEYRIVRRDGACRWLTSRGRVLVDADGRPIRMVGVSSDITELKRIEEAARDADRRKDDFLATLAHELRNPLTPLRTGLSVIGRAHRDPEVVIEQCTIMARQVQQLTRLVDDLLDVADVTRRGLPLAKTRIDLSTVVRTALDQIGMLVEDAQHDLTVTLPDQPIMLDADPVRLVQILTNLLSNAIKYTPRGGRIALLATREGNEARLSVRDSGLGLPPDKLGSIFEMFGQLDRSLETGHKGLGIGLALARALASAHGGRITANSDGLGQGSEFNVWLPVATSVETALPVSSDQRDSAGTPACRVLLVDDNRDVATSICRFVRLLGHDVRMAFDGMEAMQMAGEFRPDVVLMDIGMPKLNGYDVARKLRSETWGRQMTLVAISGWGREADHRRSIQSGFDRHMTKPIEPLVLEALLDSSARAVAAR